MFVSMTNKTKESKIFEPDVPHTTALIQQNHQKMMLVVQTEEEEDMFVTKVLGSFLWNPGSSALMVDALTTRPMRQFTARYLALKDQC